jgi:hypothetical protein
VTVVRVVLPGNRRGVVIEPRRKRTRLGVLVRLENGGTTWHELPGLRLSGKPRKGHRT